MINILVCYIAYYLNKNGQLDLSHGDVVVTVSELTKDCTQKMRNDILGLVNKEFEVYKRNYHKVIFTSITRLDG